MFDPRVHPIAAVRQLSYSKSLQFGDAHQFRTSRLRGRGREQADTHQCLSVVPWRCCRRTGFGKGDCEGKSRGFAFRARSGDSDVVSWEDPDAQTSMPAHLSPQETINRNLKKPSECDVVIVILWPRMGTPLPADTYRKADESAVWHGVGIRGCVSLRPRPGQAGCCGPPANGDPAHSDHPHSERGGRAANTVAAGRGVEPNVASSSFIEKAARWREAVLVSDGVVIFDLKNGTTRA